MSSATDDDYAPPLSFNRLYALRRRLSRHPVVAYGLAAALAGVSVLWRLTLQEPHPAPFLPLFPAIIAASLICGRGPGYLAAAISFGFAWHYVDVHRNFPLAAGDLRTLVLFALIAWIAVEIITRLGSLADALIARDAALTQRTEQLASREAELRAAYGELQSLYDEAPLGLAYLDRDLRFVRINPALAAMNGAPVADHLGKSVWDVLPQFRESAEPLLRRVIENDETVRDIELTGATESAPGTQRHWVEQFYPVHGHDGTVLGIGIFCEEVTELHRANERGKLLMREVDHRAKNLLAVINAVVRLTRETGTVEEFRRAVVGRVLALGRVHSRLAANRWEPVTLADVIRDELDVFGDAVAYAGAPASVLLPPAAAQAINMILHELATNSVKYGAFSTKGAVTLTAELEPDGEQVRLGWFETGGPPVTGAGEDGFGTSLLNTAVTRLLGGALDYRLEPAGLACTIRFPRPRIDCPDPH